MNGNQPKQDKAVFIIKSISICYICVICQANECLIELIILYMKRQEYERIWNIGQ